MEINKCLWKIFKSYIAKNKERFPLKHLYRSGVDQNSKNSADNNPFGEKDSELKYSRTETDLKNLCENLISLLNFNSGKNADISFLYLSKTVSYLCNKELLTLALKNVLEKIVKNSLSGEKIVFKVTDNYKYIKITISLYNDNKAVNYKTNKYYRGKNIRNLDKYGVSFMIVKKVVKYHDGCIIINSNNKRIAKFCIVLPKPSII